VRGNTQRALVRMLREAGALEVHIRIASPPVRWPCFYGIDFATRAELVAGSLDTEGVRRSIGADSLGYVSLEGLIAASEQPRSRLCMACFDGDYPIPLPEEARLGKHLLELTVPAELDGALERRPADTVSGAASGDPGPVRSDPSNQPSALLSVGYGAEDALRRP
jgi:amidophosphoribosyltransferase